MQQVKDEAYKLGQPRVADGGRIVQVFLDTDMRCQLDGLIELAKSAKIKAAELLPGEYVCFFNSKRTILKLLCANNVVAARKSPEGRFYDVTCIGGIIEAFKNTGKIDYDSVIKAKLEEHLGRRTAIKTD